MLTFFNRADSLWALILVLFFSVSFSDQDSATKALLLSFKLRSDRFNSLYSWVNSSDHCSGAWLGVSCDAVTGRVTGLVLENLGLTGSVKPLSQLVDLRHLSLKNNSLWFTGSSDLDLSAWPNLKHLYLSRNRFAGDFPAGVSSLRRLQRLDLSWNSFSGKIPMAEISRLPRMLTLRLESNRFDGVLEDSNSSFASALFDFDVSGNNLSGEIPKWLRHFTATSFAGNDNLCGKPLPYDCPSIPTPDVKKSDETVDKNDDKMLTVVVVFVAAAAVAAVLAVLVTVIVCRRRRRQQRNRRTWRSRDVMVKKLSVSHVGYGGPTGFDSGSNNQMVLFEGCAKGIAIGGVDELLRASAEMLGDGTVGTTYKVSMDGGDLVVVKRAKVGRFGKEVDWWLRQVLGKLRHDNIVSFRAYHRSLNHDLLLLVYDYFPSGSLHHLLHGNRVLGRTPMDWATRLKLASDAARGLSFLHEYNKKIKLFHGNLSSANILVDQLGNACVADVGLHQLLRGANSLRTSDYIAPELATTTLLGSGNSVASSASPRKYTQKCDVYSFGVVLLEMLTGKVPATEGQVSMVDWIRSVAKKECSTWDVLDVEILRNKDTEDEIVGLMHVAMLCLAVSPKDRPAMSAVYRMIEDIRTKGVQDQGGSRSVIDDLTVSAPSTMPSSPE